jgi:hypothetical protein
MEKRTIATTPASTNALPIAFAGSENSLLLQDAATGNAENPRHFRVFTKWKKAIKEFFQGQSGPYNRRDIMEALARRAKSDLRTPNL